MKRILALCLVFMLSLSLVTPAAAGTEGPVTGRFGTSAVPTVNSIAVYTDAALTSPATSLTPQQTYWIKVSVTDNDGIGNLSYLYTHLWYDSDGGAPVWAGRGAGNLPASSMGYTFMNTAGTWSRATRAAPPGNLHWFPRPPRRKAPTSTSPPSILSIRSKLAKLQLKQSHPQKNGR